jgi:ketosteroid isomerase-like protein
MTNRGQIEEIIKSLYAARLNKDAATTVKDFAEDGVFGVYGRGTGVAALSQPTKGKAAIRSAVHGLVETWHFDDWNQIDLVIDGEKAVLHWRAKVTYLPTNKSEVFDCFDIITFRDGKIVDFRQSTDTAMIMRLAT